MTSKAPGSGHLDLLELEGVARLALALLADDPRGHRLRELAGLGGNFGHVRKVNGGHRARQITGGGSAVDAHGQRHPAAVDQVDLRVLRMPESWQRRTRRTRIFTRLLLAGHPPVGQPFTPDR